MTLDTGEVMMGAWVILGLAAAFFQALSYVCSRAFTSRFHRGVVALLLMSHVVMGVFSLICLPLVLPEDMPPWRSYIVPLVSCSLFYFAGQAGLFLALKRSDASRVSPLLGLKLVVLTLITACCFGQQYSLLQWAAVFLAVAAAWLLNRAGGALHWQSVVWILCACVGYSLSDLNIKVLVECFMGLGLLHAAVLSVLLCYVFCGAFCLPGLALIKGQTRAMWVQALPFAGAWLLAMLFLFACFGSIGVVFGNIVQASRGIISIALGWLIARAGHAHLEARVGVPVLAERIGAAFMLLAAIVLFHLGA